MQGSPCSTCKRFNHEILDRNSCEAFPVEIPGEIFSGRNGHREPFDGDGGLRWVPIEGFEWLDVPENPFGGEE